MYGASQYGEAWAVVSEITRRKKSREGQVAGESPEERVETWYSHFQKLLGTPSNNLDSEEELEQVLHDTNIEDGPFTMEEYFKVKGSIKQGKSPGPDCIPSEVLKNCDLDEIVLDICR